MTPRELDLIARLCLTQAGRRLDTSVPERIFARLNAVARREGYADVPDLLIALRSSEAERLAWPVVEGLTAFERGFMEDPEILDQLGRKILPALSIARGGAPVRIWCAASGAGQEPYSLAITALEAQARSEDLKVEVYASDISVRALERARTGVFSHFEVQKGLSARRMIDHLHPLDGEWRMSTSLREMIRWRRVNLYSDSPGPTRFDVVVCRGILPLTAPQMRPGLTLNLAQSLAPGGVLVLGRDEGESEADVAPALQALAGMKAVFARNPAFRAAA
jgi:chemotaxis protein methyltransferase CheR